MKKKLFISIFFIVISVPLFLFVNKKTNLVSISHGRIQINMSPEATALSGTQNIKLLQLSPYFDHKAWYVISLGNVAVGLMTASTTDDNTGLPFEYSAQFVTRVGVSPLLALVKGTWKLNTNNKPTLTQLVSTENESGIILRHKGDFTPSSDTPKDRTQIFLQNLFPFNFPQNLYQKTSKENGTASLFFLANKTNHPETIFIPLFGLTIQSKNIWAQYASDRFLEKATVPISETAALSFKRITEEEYAKQAETISTTLLDFGWLSSLSTMPNELELFKRSISLCETETDSLNKILISKIPQSSYLSYRKLVNLARFCKSLNQKISQTQSSSNEQQLTTIGTEWKKLIKEERLELPYSITESPDLTVFYNDSIAFLWPRISTHFIYNSLEEIKDNFDLEKNRKSLLSLQLNISSLRPRSVVRADIKLIEPTITFQTNEKKNTPIEPEAIRSLEELNTTTFKSYYLNGQFFAQNSNLDLGPICDKTQGQVGIDLGDGPSIIVNSPQVRGTWDTNTRILLARQFAMKSTLSKSCHKIFFKVPKSFRLLVQNEIDEFENSTLSKDNKILLSNNVQKKILVMPGKYRLTTNSLITGETITAHEFVVEPSTNTIVNANSK